MEKITFDCGIRSYRIGQEGVLRFNPADPNVYARFISCGEKLQEIEKELRAQAKDQTASLHLLEQADKKLKEMLTWVFGPQNDFDAILGGVSLLATGENGQRVIANLLSAIQPILVEGAKQCAREIAEKAKEKQV